MKKILIHGKNGYNTVGSITDDGRIAIVNQNTEGAGNKDNTIMNTMKVLTKSLNKLAATGDVAQIATIGVVADKINSDILVKEFWNKKILSTNKALTEEELAVYSDLIIAIGATYGQVLITSQKYISKVFKPGQTKDQIEWANLFIRSEEAIENKITASREMPVAIMQEELVEDAEDALAAF